MKLSFSRFVKKLSVLGERKAINLISSVLSKGDEVVGIGDDCAAFQLNDYFLLVSTDMISEKTHIPKTMSPWQMGWFIVAINASDIAAKGGKPLGMVLSLGLPRGTTDSFLKHMMQGADSCAKKYNFSIVGGDTKENPSITLCGTVFGTVKKNHFMPRIGCKPGDIVAVTGMLGKAGAGYYAIQHEILDESVVKGLLEPIPRVNEGVALAHQKTVTSCMDISDGLSSSLYQLMELNNTGFEIEKEKIPLSPALKKLSKTHNLDVYDYALHFGGDYELLFTVPSEKFEKLKKTLKYKITEIGHVNREKKIRLVGKNSKKILKNRGYEHFKKGFFFK